MIKIAKESLAIRNECSCLILASRCWLPAATKIAIGIDMGRERRAEGDWKVNDEANGAINSQVRRKAKKRRKRR